MSHNCSTGASRKWLCPPTCSPFPSTSPNPITVATPHSSGHGRHVPGPLGQTRCIHIVSSGEEYAPHVLCGVSLCLQTGVAPAGTWRALGVRMVEDRIFLPWCLGMAGLKEHKIIGNSLCTAKR